MPSFCGLLWESQHIYIYKSTQSDHCPRSPDITDVTLLVLAVLFMPESLEGQRLLGAELEGLQGGGGVQAADVPPGEGGEHLVVSCPEPLAPEIQQQGGQGVRGEEPPLKLGPRRPESRNKKSSI